MIKNSKKDVEEEGGDILKAEREKMKVGETMYL